jgi:hypothetical protein
MTIVKKGIKEKERQHSFSETRFNKRANTKLTLLPCELHLRTFLGVIVL